MIIPFVISTSSICALFLYYLKKEELLCSENQQFRRQSLRKRGLQLYQDLQRINKFYLSTGKAIELPRYKFFTELCDELLMCFRRDGADVFPHLVSLRKNLNRDLKSEKRLSSIYWGAVLEMMVISSLSLLIFCFARYMTGIPLELASLFMALGLQGIGLGVFSFTSKLVKKRTFSSFKSHITSASLLDLGIRTSMPINLLAKRAGLEELEKDLDLGHIRERLVTIIKGLKSGSLGDLSQSEEAVEECWSVYDTKLDRYQSKIKALKLACIAAFFLSSYLFLFHSMIASAGAF